MVNLTKEIKEKAERIGDELRELGQDMGYELRSMTELIKEKAEKFSSEIKNRIIR